MSADLTSLPMFLTKKFSSAVSELSYLEIFLMCNRLFRYIIKTRMCVCVCVCSFLVLPRVTIRTTLVWQNRQEHPSNPGNKNALSSLYLMSSVRHFTWPPTSPISYMGLYTKQTQTIQHKSQDLRTVYF